MKDPIDLGNNSVDLVLSDSLDEKFHKLGIDAQLKVSLLCGLVNISGSASFLNEERKSARAARMSLVFKVLNRHVKKGQTLAAIFFLCVCRQCLTGETRFN